MDTLLVHCPSMAKRPCCSSLTESPLVLNPSSRTPKPDPLDRLLESFLGLSDCPPLSLDLSFDRLLESRPCDSDQDDMIDRAMRLGSALLEAGRRSARRRDTFHNAVVWALPPDLTIKVFSMLDTQSVCYAAATYTFFRKCASDPLCYANIDLTAVVPRVNNGVVSTMIQRAGKVLQSIKLGLVPGPTASPGSSQSLVYTIRNSVDASGFSWNDKRSRQGKESSILTRSCLSSLSGDSDAPGYVELRQTLESVSKHCHLIGRLHFESSKTGRDDSLKVQTCTDIVNNCPHLISLALRGFKLHDCKIRVLVKGFRELKYVDFSRSYSITGAFLRSLGGNAGGNQLEVLILRDCMHLKEVEVAKFLTAAIAGDFKLLRHLDISNREGLASEGDWYHRCYSTSVIPVKQLLDKRPGFCLLAEFPDEGSFSEIEQMVASEAYSDFSSPSQPSNHTSDGTMFTSSSEIIYHSDQGSGNEDCRESNYIIYEESSDEVDFLAG
ncbi:hypothetical protein Acr_17g0003040 [Actinidia rufa]|uniref:RNI-like superfamily protein n=1 Tax=Actinidia rufa TaxID=165716 RepID=A0A7J0G1T8_9ERIC|nr:hypothetical protein Acr_17g0003040 [Actinidia rufa]